VFIFSIPEGKLTIVCLLALLAFGYAEDKHDHWAVIVAGSNGFWNYRHQADVCHAYQIMKNNGIPEEQIILLSYDDVASASQNPFPGQLFNQPDGEDVYAGCNIDYKGSDVTPDQFLKVLKGEGNGKVLKSNSASKVFINFADHGAPDLIAFPRGELHANDFHDALLYMHENKMYSEMTIYIEACESGSMFEGILEDNLNIYATTAANPTESSWGYYCSPDDTVQGKHIGSCLGDLYSIAWMEDSEKNDICAETLEEQFDIVKKRTDKSEVMKFGDLNFFSEMVGNFQGTCDCKNTLSNFLRTLKKEQPTEDREYSAVESRDIKMHYLYHKYMRTNLAEDAQELQDEVASRQAIDARFASLRANSGINYDGNARIQSTDCYKSLIETYKQSCGWDEYDLKFMRDLVNLCNSNTAYSKMFGLISNMC